ncbi:MAG TPA: ferrous iron transport protein B [Deltaproteobacteria bacterium]|nr:ferrous iron transport protein B [Deltaproteobacteria bacterium]HIJ39470.1 ferrous iron transport protein B [Deltaproteobacteria bacterium]
MSKKKIQPPEKKKVVIVGLPNTGKTQLFNNLTGKYGLVANCPLTTIELKRADCPINGQTYEVIDTPGLHGLYVDSEEELSVRDLIFSENPDVIIQCIDANQLKQSFTLSADLLELGAPLVISLNALDETLKKGVRIDSQGLSDLLHVPVVESAALNGRGTKALMEAVGKARVGKTGIEYGDALEEGISTIEAGIPTTIPYRRKAASLLLMNDPFVENFLEGRSDTEELGPIKRKAAEIRERYPGNIGMAISRKRSEWVDAVTEKVVRRQNVSWRKFAENFARLSRAPLSGVPILLTIIFAMYLLVVNVANNIAGWMDGFLWVPLEAYMVSICPPGFWRDFLIGDYGVLSLGLANALITVLPILSVFFLMFNVLEDTGYLPNLCVLTKRIFEKLGLSGAAIMPLVLGFGCKTMATLTTKTIHSKREKFIAIYLIGFCIPCAAQMGLNMSILGRLGAAAFAIAFSVLTVVEIAAGVILNKTLKKEERSDFIQELPPMRMPSVKAVLVKTYYRLYWFLKESVPVFIYAALALFALDKLGILGAFKMFLSPLMKGLLGLPLEMVDALILCMARHEAAAALIMNLIHDGKLDFIQCIVAVTITTMFVPCFANIMAMIKELGTKTALGMTLAINTSAFLIAGALNWGLILTFAL